MRAGVGRKVYWSSFRSSNGGTQEALGYEYVYDLDAQTNTEICSQAGKAHWLAVYDAVRNRIYGVGQAHKVIDNRLYSAVMTINTTNDACGIEFMDETGEVTDDINELIGVVDDDTQIVAGEGGVMYMYGGDFPNGAGIWTIPKATIDDASTYTRTYEDANVGWSWFSLCKRGSTYFGLLNNVTDGSFYIKSSSDLVNWAVAVDGSSRAINDVRGTMVYHPGQDKVYAAVGAPSGQSHVQLHIYNGTTWSTVTLTDTEVPGTSPIYLKLMVLGDDLAVSVSKYASGQTHTIYRITNLGTTPTTSIMMNASTGCVVDSGYAYMDGVLYYATCYPGALRSVGIP